MNMILSTGSNLGDRIHHLNEAKRSLSLIFKLVEESPIYESPAVDYLNQPDFLNQVLSFEIPSNSPDQVLKEILSIEKDLGRIRNINKGPRTVDIDILFWGDKVIKQENLEIPHPRLFERSFIVSPLKDLSGFAALSNTFQFKDKFDNQCWLFKP